MNREWSFYDPATGRLARRHISLPDGEDAARHAPSGHLPIEGRHDWDRCRVNRSTGRVVKCRPLKPAASDERTWHWDAAADAWLARPTTLALARQARAKRDELLGATDWVVARAVERGESVPAEWVRYREALRAVPEQEGFPQNVEWPMPPS